MSCKDELNNIALLMIEATLNTKRWRQSLVNGWRKKKKKKKKKKNTNNFKTNVALLYLS